MKNVTLPMRKASLAFGLAVALSALVPQYVFAVNDTWSSSGTGTVFSGVGDWTSGSAPGSAGTTTIELTGSSPSGTSLTDDIPLLNILGFQVDAGAPAYTISGTNGATGSILYLDNNGGTVITNNSSNTLTIADSGTINHSSLTVNFDQGPGPVVFTGFMVTNQNSTDNYLFNATTTFAGGFSSVGGNRANLFAGGSNVTITGYLQETGAPADVQSLEWEGSGTLTLNGTNTAQGNHSGQAGTLDDYYGTTILNGSAGGTWQTISSAHAIINVGNSTVTTNSGTLQNTGNAILEIEGNYNLGTAATGTSTLVINGGNGPATGQGTLTMLGGGASIFTVNNATAGTVALTMAGAANSSILNMEIANNTSDEIVLANSGALSIGAGGVKLNITNVGTLTGGANQVDTLISAGSGVNASNFTLVANTGNFGGYRTAALSSSSTTLTLTLSNFASTPSTAYWTGNQGVGGIATWTTIAGGTNANTNWATSAAGTTDTNQVPGSTTNVLFSESSGGSNLNTSLGGGNVTINSLEFTSAASTSSQVTIGSGTLTLGVSGTNFEGLNNAGITVDAGAGTQTVNSTLALGGNQTWNVNNLQANPLTVNGAVTGAHALTIGGPGEVILAGSNSYTGNTTVNNGALLVNGTLYGIGSGAAVSVSGTGAGTTVLGGSGLINAAVTVGGGSGSQEITGGSPTANGTLTLANGLTINSGGIVYFDNPAAAGGNFINITGGSLTANAGAVIEVATSLTGTYELIGGAAGVNLGNITLDFLNGSPVGANYTLGLNSGTLQLQVTQSLLATPTINIGSARVFSGKGVTLSGTVGNSNTAAGAASLSGTLADNSGAQTAGSGTLNISTLSPSNPLVVAGGGSTPYTATINNVGTSIGYNQVNVIVTDGNASPSSAVASGTVSVVTNRVVSATPVSYGIIHAGLNSGVTALTSPGVDNSYTRVTVATSSGSDANGVSYSGNNTGTFNGAYSATGALSSNFIHLGALSGTISLVTTGEGLAGESPINVPVSYTAQVFSGKATWNGSSNDASWGSNSDWGDTQTGTGGPGAPGLSGALSAGDTATFSDVPGESSGTTVSLNGVNPSLAALTFNSVGTSYTISAGSGGTITMQNGATITTTTGTATISAGLVNSGSTSLANTGLLVYNGNVFTGTAGITSGTLEFTLPGILGQAGPTTLDTASGATLYFNTGTNQNLAPITGDSVTIGGTGRLLISTTGTFQFHNASGGNINMNMIGGVIEIASGVVQDGGLGGIGGTGNSTQGNGAITWTNNLASLQIDSGAVFDPWDGGQTNLIVVDALLGSGTFTRLGYSNTQNFATTIGANNGSGTFSGVITNLYGPNSFIKEGTGLQVFSGNNSYSGSTSIIGGTLRTTTNTGLGFGGPEYTGMPAGPVFVSGTSALGSTLDLYGSITVNSAITLKNGSLVNNDASTTALLDSGVAAVSVAGTQAGVGTSPTLTPSGGNGAGAAFTAGSGTAPGSTNDYAEVTTPGTGYTVAPTLAFGGGVTGLTATAILSSLTISGTGDAIGGAGNLTINAQVSGTGSVTVITSGTLTLSGSNIYTGTTTVGSGNLDVTNSMGSAAGTGPVNLTPGSNAPATISGNGNINGLVTTTPGTALNVAHIAPGVNTGGNFGSANTLTLSGGLTLGAGTNLDFDISNSSTTAGSGINDLINLNGGTLTLPSGAGTITINYNVLLGGAPVAGSAYTLIGGAAINNFSAANFISTGTDGETPTYSVSGSNLQVTFSVGGATPTTYTLAVTPGASRVMQGGTMAVTSIVANTGTSPADSLAYTGLGNASAVNGSVSGSPSAGTLSPLASATNTTTYTAGSVTGLDSITSTATGTNATLGTAATLQSNTSGTIAVLANRVVAATAVNYGDVLESVGQTGTTTLTTNSGDDNHATRITVSAGSATDGTATVTTGTGSVLFNGNGVSANRSVTASFATSGSTSGTLGMSVSGEGLAGETDTAPSVTYTANVFQAALLTTSVTSGTNLSLTNAASTDGGANGQRAGATITGWNTSSNNFVVTTTGGAVASTNNGGNATAAVGTLGLASGLLSGTYNYSGSITATAQYTDPALQAQGSIANPVWTGVSLSGTVNASNAYGLTGTAAIANGGSLAGFGLTSSQGNGTQAQLLAGTSSANINLTMAFTAHGTLGETTSIFQSSDTLTLGGLHPTGGNGPDNGSIITDSFVLQLSVTTNPNVLPGTYYLGWWDPATSSWVNAIAGNSNAIVPLDYGLTGSYYAGTYAQWEAANPGLTTLNQQLGAYGYDSTTGVAWAVLNYDSEVQVIPEPATSAMIFGGFGLLIGFRRLRRRNSSK